MKAIEAVALVRYLRAHFPSQPIDEYTSEAFHELLEPYSLEDCRTAVRTIAERGDEWCPPTIVKAEVKRIREKRLADYGPIEPPADLDPDDIRGYQRWLGSMREAIADGTLTAPVPPPLVERRDVIAELGQIGREVPDA